MHAAEQEPGVAIDLAAAQRGERARQEGALRGIVEMPVGRIRDEEVRVRDRRCAERIEPPQKRTPRGVAEGERGPGGAQGEGVEIRSGAGRRSHAAGRLAQEGARSGAGIEDTARVLRAPLEERQVDDARGEIGRRVIEAGAPPAARPERHCPQLFRRGAHVAGILVEEAAPELPAHRTRERPGRKRTAGGLSQVGRLRAKIRPPRNRTRQGRAKHDEGKRGARGTQLFRQGPERDRRH